MSWISKIFEKNEYTRNCYAITHGSYKGNLFVYIYHDDKEFNFLSLPDNIPVSVPVDVFLSGIKSKIVDHIERLPGKVYEICKAQYNEAKTKDDINRLKQSPPQSSVDNGEHKNEA